MLWSSFHCLSCLSSPLIFYFVIFFFVFFYFIFFKKNFFSFICCPFLFPSATPLYFFFIFLTSLPSLKIFFWFCSFIPIHTHSFFWKNFLLFFAPFIKNFFFYFSNFVKKFFFYFPNFIATFLKKKTFFYYFHFATLSFLFIFILFFIL